MNTQPQYSDFPWMLIVVGGLGILALLSGCSDEKPTQRDVLDSMTVAQYVPGTENYTVWSLTQ